MIEEDNARLKDVMTVKRRFPVMKVRRLLKEFVVLSRTNGKRANVSQKIMYRVGSKERQSLMMGYVGSVR